MTSEPSLGLGTAFDTSLIDPLLLSPNTRRSLLPPQLPLPQQHSHSIEDITVEQQHEHDSLLDPLLRNLSNQGAAEVGERAGSMGGRGEEEYFTQPIILNHQQPIASTSEYHFLPRTEDESDSDSQGDDEEEEEGEAELEESPSDPTAQVEQLREMDQQATESLVSNRQYQEELKGLMEKFQAASKRTLQLQAVVKSLSAELLSGKELKIFVPPTTQEPSLPWFKHYHGRDLPLNEDAIKREDYLKTTRFWPWSGAERTKLKQEVMAHNHRKIALEAAEKGDDLAEKLASVDSNWYIENTDGLEWETIARVIPRRSAIDCRIQWLQHDHPSLNFRKFSKEEMNIVIELVEGERKMDNWEDIAKELGNGRVGWDCLRKFRGRTGQRIEWTAEQDEKLLNAVKLHGENWQIIARICNKHSNACINRWSKSLRPSITKGKWSSFEDSSLRTAVALVGTNWKLVAPRVKGRTDAQCRERWTNVLDPKLVKKKPWTEEEDKELLEAKEKGMSWAEIARELYEGARTDNKCMRRWQDLQKKPKPKKPKAKPKRKRLPKDSDVEDNVPLVTQDESVGGGEVEGPPPAKRPKRQVQTRNPELAQLLAQELEEDERRSSPEIGGAASGSGGGALGQSLRAGGDIVVDVSMFADDEDSYVLPAPGGIIGGTELGDVSMGQAQGPVDAGNVQGTSGTAGRGRGRKKATTTTRKRSGKK